MKDRVTAFFDFIIYWTIVLIPFSMAIAPAPANVFMGFLLFSFLMKKLLTKDKLFINTAINLPLLLFFIITCLSIIHSINIKDTMRGGIFRLLSYISILFILSEELKDKRHIWKVIIAMLAGITLVSIDEIWQVFTGYDFIRGYSPIINIGLVRATASFKDANTLGIYLSAIAPLVLGMALYYFKSKKKVMMALLSILTLAGIALTYSRPSLLAIYIVLWFFAIARRHKALIIFLITFTFLLPFLLPKSVKDWAKDVEYNPLRFMCNDDRIAIYRNSFNMIKGHPLIGLGANTYMKNYKKYKESPEYRNIITADYIYAHNNFLHMAAEIGLIGLGIFIWLLYKLFIACAGIYKSLGDNFLKITSLSLSACLIAFLINGLTESSLYYSRVALIFWYIAGFSLGLNKFANVKR